MGGRRGAHVAEGVRARRGHGRAGRRDERVGRGVRRDPDADGVEAGGHEVGHLRAAGEHEGERAGPEARGEGAHARVVGRRDPAEVGRVREVHDERVERRAGLHLEDAGHRPRVEGVGAEAVDGLGGEGHEPAPAQDARPPPRSRRGRRPAGCGRSRRAGRRAARGPRPRGRARPACRRPRGCRGRRSSGARSRSRGRPGPRGSARAPRREARAKPPAGSLTSITESRTGTPRKRRAELARFLGAPCCTRR